MARREIRPLSSAQAAQSQNEGVRFFASNPGQHLTARFLDGALRVESGRGGEWAGTLALTGGAKVEPVVVGDRVEYRHPDGVTEWYVNRPEGIEQGFTLAARPANAAAGEVRVDLDLEGLTARAVEGEEALDFVDEATGEAVLRYDKLLVWDATGRELSARLEAQGGDVAILVADAGAAYPLTIDPLITSQEAKLGALYAVEGDQFGSSVALSGDTALVGAHRDDDGGIDSGSAYVFVRSGTAWSQQAQLVAADAAADDYFGNSVALSGDTALVGANGDNVYSGSAYVFRLFPPDITVEQPLGTALVDGTASVGFGSQPIGGSSAPQTFTIRNSGGSDLTSIGITMFGADAGAFTVDTAGMLTVLPPGDSTTFTVTFTAAGAVTTLRSAALHIASNAPGTKNPFDIMLSGTALSPASDTDADGLNDAAEFRLSSLGFNWQVSQPALVATLLDNANVAGLYTPTQVQALNVGVPLLTKDAGTGKFKLTIGVEKSTTLLPGSFLPFPMTAPEATINGAGKLEFQFTAPDNAAFFRLESQ